MLYILIHYVCVMKFLFSSVWIYMCFCRKSIEIWISIWYFLNELMKSLLLECSLFKKRAVINFSMLCNCMLTDLL